jgi:hypothetical protein
MEIEQVLNYLKEISDKVIKATNGVLETVEPEVIDNGDKKYLINLIVNGKSSIDGKPIELAKLKYTFDLVKQTDQEIKYTILLSWTELTKSVLNELDKKCADDKRNTYVV